LLGQGAAETVAKQSQAISVKWGVFTLLERFEEKHEDVSTSLLALKKEHFKEDAPPYHFFLF